MKIKTIIFFSITLILFILVTSGVCMDVYTVNYKNYRIVNAKMQRFETDELSHDSLYYLLSFDIPQIRSESVCSNQFNCYACVRHQIEANDALVMPL